MKNYKKALELIAKAKERNLIELDLGDLGLTALPPELFELIKLEVLALANNRLTSLPPELGKLTQLEVLYLSNNRLTGLPPEMGQLKNLKWLYLARNHLTALPPELFELTKLKGLFLSNNKLTAFPPEMGRLTSAQILYEYNLLEEDFYINSYPVIVLTSERTLVGCTIIDNEFLLADDYDDLIQFAEANVADESFIPTVKQIKKWQAQLSKAINGRFTKNQIPFNGEPYPPKKEQSILMAYGL